MGLIALAEGNWRDAEYDLINAVANNRTPLINFLCAAKAAQEQQAYKRRDDYIRQAHKANPDAKIAIGLTQAGLQIEHKQLEQALATLCHLREIAPKHRYVLKLQKQVYEKLQDWQQVANLIPLLKKYRICDAASLEQLEHKTYIKLLQNNQATLTEIESIWQQLSKKIRRDENMAYAYITQLMRHKQFQTAETVIRDSLKRNWDARLVTYYGELENLDDKKLLHYAEHWLKQQKHDAELLLTLGKLCARQHLWGKAKYYYEQSLNYQTKTATYIALGHLHEHLGDIKSAADCYKKALTLD